MICSAYAGRKRAPFVITSVVAHNFCNGYRVDLYLILSLDIISTCHLTPLRAGDAIPTRDTITLSDEEMFTSNVI